MYSMQNDIMYLQSRRKVTQYYVLSLLSDFMKTVLFLFDTLVFCFTISTALLMMLFGYMGVIAEKPFALHGKLYIGTVYFDILLNFLIALSFLYNIFKLSTWNISYMGKYIVNRNFFYSIMTMIIGLCLLSIVFNIYAIYYTRRFKTLVRVIENEAKNARTNTSANARPNTRSNLRQCTKGNQNMHGNDNSRINTQGNSRTSDKLDKEVGSAYMHVNVFPQGNARAQINAPPIGSAQQNENEKGCRNSQDNVNRQENIKEEVIPNREKLKNAVDENQASDETTLEDPFPLEIPSTNEMLTITENTSTKINDMKEENTKTKVNTKKKITFELDKEQQDHEAKRKMVTRDEIVPLKIGIIKDVKEKVSPVHKEEKKTPDVNNAEKEVTQSNIMENKKPQMNNAEKNI
ncbi:hypothetical protein, conserved [Plasmodium gonderi]|uniref:Uncharacterized protein n=1 Tax=Plasmodium gonderi TaxID=77519 RepID=A0A1Y1JPI9_PLAGO|nr:hypothetical protein, conserved [Plasmodium gonderi]GAW82752.1 hypothetical protein, conserved [Plasmodium gonderi]